MKNDFGATRGDGFCDECTREMARDGYWELQQKSQLCFESSIENAERMWNLALENDDFY